MRNKFPLFQSHLDLAHAFWFQLVHVGDTVIDATCGNGHDTLKLCTLALAPSLGKVYAVDNQEAAILSTMSLIRFHLLFDLQNQIEYHQQCHSTFPSSIQPDTVRLIVYNLGYLPGSDKTHTTQTSSTLQSLSEAEKLLQPGGVISITCYPGHSEGAIEQTAIADYLANLAPKSWSITHHQWLNRSQAPSLIFIQKAL